MGRGNPANGDGMRPEYDFPAECAEGATNITRPEPT